jgi:hypothetical protein
VLRGHGHKAFESLVYAVEALRVLRGHGHEASQLLSVLRGHGHEASQLLSVLRGHGHEATNSLRELPDLIGKLKKPGVQDGAFHLAPQGFVGPDGADEPLHFLPACHGSLHLPYLLEPVPRSI